ncbi:uncharacterized protein LOC124267872 [Haliotis rubra]|uniref:uncharacterized protein LOC124267872 n=1 Tax=Haliotis rubra TaxID=36100 RepID=UPI001EE5AC55|nr:uncharacterized protein LOC124267872 [Haliotis rubra]
MAQHCCVPTCSNDSRYPSGRNLSFHNIPKDQDLRKRWIISIRRDEGPLFKVTDSTHVCSAHFNENSYQRTLTGIRRLKKGAVPTIFSWKEKKERQPPRKRTRSYSYEDNLTDISSGPDHSSEDVTTTPAPMPDHDYANPPTSTADQLESLKQYTKKLEDQLAAVCSKRFGINRFTHDQDLIQFYTGFRTYDDFISTFNALKPTAVNMVRWSQVQRHRSSNAENPQLKSSVSDKEITKQCGILDLLDVGDDVMADKGFVIQDLLTPKGAKLIIPPFLREKGQFSRREVKETQEIARLRIHIERAIRRCKYFSSVIESTLDGHFISSKPNAGRDVGS